MNKKGISTSKIIVFLIVVTALILFVIAIAFMEFDKIQNKSDNKKVNTGTISILFSNNVNGINMENYVPVADEVGEKLIGDGQYFDFTVNAEIEGETKVDYEMVLEKNSDCNIDDNYIKVYLEKENDGTYSKVFESKSFVSLEEDSDVGSPTNAMLLAYGSYKTSSKDKYRLRTWIDETAVLTTPAICTLEVNIYAKAE